MENTTTIHPTFTDNGDGSTTASFKLPKVFDMRSLRFYNIVRDSNGNITDKYPFHPHRMTFSYSPNEEYYELTGYKKKLLDDYKEQVNDKNKVKRYEKFLKRKEHKY